MVLLEWLPPTRYLRPLLGIGFLGAYTTFSTFTFETVPLVEDGAWRYAAWNLGLSGPLSFAGALRAFLVVR
jgi:fluoride exporter